MLGETGRAETHFWLKIRDLFSAKPDSSSSRNGGGNIFFKTINGISFKNVLIVGRIVEVRESALIIQDGPILRINVDNPECQMSHPLSALKAGDCVRVLGSYSGEMSVIATHSVTKMTNRDLSVMHIEFKDKNFFYSSQISNTAAVEDGRNSKSLNKRLSILQHLSTPVALSKTAAEVSINQAAVVNGHALEDFAELTKGIHFDGIDDIESIPSQPANTIIPANINQQALDYVFSAVARYPQGISLLQLLSLGQHPIQKQELERCLLDLQECGRLYLADDLYCIL